LPSEIAEESAFFAYAEVRYVSGLTLTSLIGYATRD
jgi:hypothetical protein